VNTWLTPIVTPPPALTPPSTLKFATFEALLLVTVKVEVAALLTSSVRELAERWMVDEPKIIPPLPAFIVVADVLPVEPSTVL